MLFIGQGDGRDGLMPNSGVVNTYASGMSASPSSRVVSTTLTVAEGDMVLLHQTIHSTNHGLCETVRVASVGVNEFTADRDIVNTYSSSGSDKAQAVLVPQYAGAEPTGVITASAWDGSKGGVFAAASVTPFSGRNGGSINLTGKGFRGGNAGNDGSGTGGEGYTGTHGHGNTNDNGGSSTDAAAGGGGGNRTQGTKNGTGLAETVSGLTAGSADASRVDLGGGSGGSSTNSNPRDGVIGGGIGFLFGSNDEMPLISDGIAGINSTSDAGSGGSAAGFFYQCGPELNMGTGLSHCNGKTGGTGREASATGGTGGEGGFRLEGCAITGTTSPSFSPVEGGQDFCQSFIHIY